MKTIIPLVLAFVLTGCGSSPKAAGTGDDCVWFKVSVDVNGDGGHRFVSLWARIGPGDTAEPVITIMLTTED